MDPRIELVITLVETEPARELSVGELCDRLNVSPSHLQHLFKRDVHMSLRQFILHVRLRAAARMIDTTRERIRQISFAAGFRDISNVNHAFKRQYGVSPRAYRLRSILSSGAFEQQGNGGANQ
jgi:transcriptional regulator GlxA family with amidase domain